MPNIKSAKKRVVVSEKKAGVNKAFNTTVKTTLKKFDKALEAGDQAAVAAAHRDAVRKLDTAAAKGYVHKNTAARRKSRMAKKISEAK
ncbi:MAG: 30S ribosomal protein S20 [Clostridia bacterium]|nr:30S ribosomal protein S20 [Clostridia bacterium]